MKIKFLPQNIEVEGTPNKSLLQIATENKLEIRSICKGVPSCAECRVRITEGERNVLPPTKAELNLIGSSHFIDGRRLSCQVRCYGDVTIDLSEQVERAEHQTKKIRGFRSQKQIESQAVNDTFLLDVKEEPTPRRDQQQPHEAQDSAEQSPEQAPAQPPRQQQQQQRQGQQQQRQQGQQQNRNEGRQQSSQKSGQQQQQSQKQGQQQNQGRNNNNQRRDNNQPRQQNQQAKGGGNQPRGNQQPQQSRDNNQPRNNQPRNNQPREAQPRKDDNQASGDNPKKDQN
jgi:ferredoxin